MSHSDDPRNQESSAFGGLHDATDPSSGPDATPKLHASRGQDADKALAESLLHDLQRTPLPMEGVPETSGHTAAAYAVSARRPPRAQEDVTFEPAVVVNMTEPLPIDLGRRVRDEPTLVDPARRATDPNDPRHRKTMPAMRPVGAIAGSSQAPTVVGERAQRKQVLLGIVSVIGIATLVAIVILAFAPRTKPALTNATATASELIAATATSVTASSAASVAPVATVVVTEPTAMIKPSAALPPASLPFAPPAPPAPPVLAATSSSAPVHATSRATSSARPLATPSARGAATARPQGNFEEPDRNF